MQMTPLIAVHMSAAITALGLCHFGLWARLGRAPPPRLHRALGYAWVTCMIAAAVSAVFIRDFRLPNITGYTPVHLLIPITFFSLYRAFKYLLAGNFQGHRLSMQWLYFSACIVAGSFTLLPGRYLGHLIWSDWLGWI